MKKIKAALAATALLLSGQPSLAGNDPFIGEVITVTFHFCPVGWAELNGALLSISEYDSLFQLFGTTYGGDGENTFRLPIGTPVFAGDGIALRQCIALYGTFPPRP